MEQPITPPTPPTLSSSSLASHPQRALHHQCAVDQQRYIAYWNQLIPGCSPVLPSAPGCEGPVSPAKRRAANSQLPVASSKVASWHSSPAQQRKCRMSKKRPTSQPLRRGLPIFETKPNPSCGRTGAPRLPMCVTLGPVEDEGDGLTLLGSSLWSENGYVRNHRAAYW
jgi:hypothetical protein